MSYKHDIFISYRRDEETRNWLNRHFIPILKNKLSLELGEAPEVYTDQNLEVGAIWPVQLGDEIGSSRILIILWTKTYLQSVWCASEMSHMLERQSKYFASTPLNPHGIIISFVIHDGETIPPPLKISQMLEIQDCYNTRMSIYSQKAAKLSDAIGLAAQGIATAIKSAPDWQSQWNISAQNDFYNQYFDNKKPAQGNPSKFT